MVLADTVLSRLMLEMILITLSTGLVLIAAIVAIFEGVAEVELRRRLREYLG